MLKPKRDKFLGVRVEASLVQRLESLGDYLRMDRSDLIRLLLDEGLKRRETSND
jgi:metal-responsive CopG/Arc/MetJ family transcriptional regulator